MFMLLSRVSPVHPFDCVLLLVFHILICFKDGDFTLKHTGLSYLWRFHTKTYWICHTFEMFCVEMEVWNTHRVLNSSIAHF
jgi:hypothetical protein